MKSQLAEKATGGPPRPGLKILFPGSSPFQRYFGMIFPKSLSGISLFFGLSCIVIIRTTFELMLEDAHTLTPTADFFDTVAFYAHAYIFWICLFVTLGFLTASWLSISLRDSMAIVLLFAPVSISVPFVDYALNGGGALYYGVSFKDFWHNYFNLFNPTASVTMVTTGIRVEVFIVAIVSFICARFLFAKSTVRSLLFSLSLYTTIFFFGYLPALMPNIRNISENERDIFMFLIVSIGLSSLLWGRLCLRDSRWRKIPLYLLYPSRLSFYLLLLVFGMLLSSQKGGVSPAVFSLAWFCRMLLAAAAITLLFAYAKLQNDNYDRNIDAISNAERASLALVLTPDVLVLVRTACLVFAGVFAIGAGPQSVLLSAVIFVLSAVYSEPPLRLRRFYPIGHYVLSLIGTTVFLLGGSIMSGGQFFNFTGVPVATALVFLSFFSLSHIKDLKDMEGDFADGVANVYNLVGNPRLVVAAAIVLFASTILTLCFTLFASKGAYVMGVAVYLIVALGVLKMSRELHRIERVLPLSFAFLVYVSVVWLLEIFKGSAIW